MLSKTKEECEEAAKNSYSISGMCRALGWNPVGSYRTVKKYIELYNIDISHFTGKKYWKEDPTRLSVEDYSKSYYCKGSRLFKKLIEEGKKEYKCECCELTEWQGQPIPLEVHHIDGNHNNNNLNNLQILCPNCHAQTDNYKNRGKNIKNSKQYFCKNCGRQITKESQTGLCLQCSHILRRKVEWPEKEYLALLHDEFSNNEIAKMYNVSAITVRKWLKYYNLWRDSAGGQFALD